MFKATLRNVSTGSETTIEVGPEGMSVLGDASDYVASYLSSIQTLRVFDGKSSRHVTSVPIDDVDHLSEFVYDLPVRMFTDTGGKRYEVTNVVSE